MSATRDYLSMFVITHGTADYGDKYAVREQRVMCDSVFPEGFRPSDDAPNLFIAEQPLAVVDTLEEARAAVPPGNVLLGRDPGDLPVIVEVWV